jgi:hypothetical protein
VKPSDETYTYCLQDIEMTHALYKSQLVYTNYRRRRPNPRRRRALKRERLKRLARRMAKTAVFGGRG